MDTPAALPSLDSSYQREKQLFNTGPHAGKTLPSPMCSVMASGAGNARLDERAPPPPPPLSLSVTGVAESHAAATAAAASFLPPLEGVPSNGHCQNECSNLSSAGSVSSDREAETPEKKAATAAGLHTRSAVATGATSRALSISERKPPRKRRRPDVDTPKSERKITEFIRTQQASSPRHAVSAAPGASGDSSSCDGWNAAVHTAPAVAASPSRTTPTLGLAYGSSDGSNQSPPSGGSSRTVTANRVDDSTQTESGSGDLSSVAAASERMAQLTQANSELLRSKVDLQRANDNLQTKVALEKKRVSDGHLTIMKLLVEKANMERESHRDRLDRDKARFGEYKFVVRGDQTIGENFVDGYGREHFRKKKVLIANRRTELGQSVLLLRKRKPQPDRKTDALPGKRSDPAQSSSLAASQPSTSCSADEMLFARPDLPQELSVQEYAQMEEMYRMEKERLKKEEIDLAAKLERYERKRQLYIRESKRFAHEQESHHKSFELLCRRFLPVSLLGKGGFSEVWKTWDLEENRWVACKIHSVVKEWKEEKKANYVKHAIREKDIHKKLNHPRIVRLWDVFTIDINSFCTVLEYCEGHDLDFYLKVNKAIPEQQARSIVSQVVSALVYLSEQDPAIIHYDLKPANILLVDGSTTGQIKITDFGLSKLIEKTDCQDGIELTSQFAGTYWYLPPETFLSVNARISPKVDVWSVGVIFYQCLYNARPFGNDLSQQRILAESTILNATELRFPSKPQISGPAQDFIRRCLQYKCEDRADIYELAKHELLRPKTKASTAGASSALQLQPPSSPASRPRDSVDSDF